MTIGPTDPLFTPHRPHEDDRRPISEVLTALAFEWPQERITLGDIVDNLADRGYGILMLLLALPTTLPIAPPGLSAAFGLPLAAIALQLAIGWERPWLPAIALRRSFATADFRQMIARSMPLLKRLERVLRPRLPMMTGWVQDRIVGAACALLGGLLATPVPFTNIPLSFAIVFLALGLLTRDGLAVVLGIVSGIGAIVLLGYAGIASWDAISPLLGFAP